MSGPLGTGSGGGSGGGKDVLAGTGISVSGTTAFTVDNTGVLSLAGSGVSVSSSTGNVTVTGPTISGGTGISIAGGGTTSLTVSATGVNTVSAGTGISVSGTTSLTVSNTGVTSIVAGTNVTVSGATGAVTINAPGFATPGSSAIGDTAAAGTAITVSRSDHVHGREAAGTPGASAVGDTASAGSATTVARSDHRHSREAFGTPVALSGTAANGSATTVARSDHQHGGTVAFPLGTASAPSIVPSGDTNTGLWSPAADTLALSTGGSERLRVTSSGQVLMGTTSLNSYFAVGINGNILASKSGIIENVTESTDGAAYIEINACLTSGAANAILTFSTANVIKWYQTLDYNTNRLYLTDQNNNDGVYIAQNATSWTANSDSRLKDVHGTITNALDKVQQLTGVHFTWKRDADNPDAKVRVGLIAQDVQAVLPEAVDDESPDLIADEETGKISGGLGVRYTELVPLLVNAIKELAMQHQLLQTRVAALEVQP